MTAIAVAYDPIASRFVIAADGRCASDALPMVIKTDKQQKIFPIQKEHMTIAYAMTGFASTDDGSFETIVEADRQVKLLAKRQFVDGYEFSGKFCFNMTRVIEKALETGRIAKISASEELPQEERGRMLRFFILGFFKRKAFWRIASFYHNEMTHRLSVRPQDLELSQFRFACTGSDKIASMIYGNATVDPRIAAYKHTPSGDAEALTATTNFVKACSDPAAVAVDPWCRIVGGYIHAAELTQIGFRWSIPPVI